MTDLRALIAKLKQMRAEDQRFLDKLNNDTSEGVDIEARAENLRDLNIAAEVDTRVIQALEEISRTHDTTTMVERPGYVLAWTGNISAVVALIVTAVILYTMNDHPSHYTNEAPVYWSIVLPGCAAALALFGIGRALRYVFSGKK